MPGKPLDPENLHRDLQYVLYGTFVHEFLYRVCNPRPGLGVLEPGCGSGKLGLSFAFYGGVVTLMDVDPGVLVYTRELAKRVSAFYRIELSSNMVAERNGEVAIIQGNIHQLESLALRESRYGHICSWDFVFSEGVPQHWPASDWRRQSAINQMVKVTKPGGTVCIVGSNALCPEMMDYARRVDHTYHSMPPKQVPFTPEEISRRMERAGLRDVQVIPLESQRWEESKLLGAWGTK